MQKVYLLILIFGLLVGIYLSGMNNGKSKCIQRVAEQSVLISKQQNIKREKINAMVYRLGVDDIRNSLRAKYTIAEW